MNFSQALNPNLIKANIESTEKIGAINELADLLVKNYPQIDKENLLNAVFKRETEMSTGIMTHVALPHCRLNDVDDFIVCAGVSKKGIEYGSLDSMPVFFMTMLVVSEKGSDSHLTLLKDLCTIAKESEFFDELLQSKDSEQILEIIRKYETKN